MPKRATNEHPLPCDRLRNSQSAHSRISYRDRLQSVVLCTRPEAGRALLHLRAQASVLLLAVRSAPAGWIPSDRFCKNGRLTPASEPPVWVAGVDHDWLLEPHFVREIAGPRRDPKVEFSARVPGAVALENRRGVVSDIHPLNSANAGYFCVQLLESVIQRLPTEREQLDRTA